MHQFCEIFPPILVDSAGLTNPMVHLKIDNSNQKAVIVVQWARERRFPRKFLKITLRDQKIFNDNSTGSYLGDIPPYNITTKNT